ncbi:MAG TPA: extracellular solute-binding protein, partial [Chloroflexota bacterium]
MTRRHLLVAGIAISGSVLVACSQQSTPAPTTAPAQPTTASAQATTAPAPAAATTAPAQPTTAPAQATTAPAQAAAPSATPQPAAQAAAPSSGQKTLKFSSYSFSTFEDAMKKMLSSWDPSVTVQTEFAGGSDYWNKVQVEIASGTTPDLGIGEFNRIVSYAKDGAIMALDDYIRTDKFSLDPYVPSGIDQYRWKKGDFDSGGTGGQMFGLPGDAQPYIFVYNKTMFDEAKVAYPTDDWTWDDVVTAGKQITKADQNKWGAYAPTLGQFNEGEWVLSAGGRILSADNKTSGLDTPETMSAYKWAWDLMYTHKIAPKPVPNEATNPFASGRVAMNWDGVWQVEEFAKIKEFQWDMVMH